MVEQPGIGTYLCRARRSTSVRRAAAPMRAPMLGEHTDEILVDVLGMAAGEVGRLHDAGVVRRNRWERARVDG